MKPLQLTSILLSSIALVACVDNGNNGMASGGPGGGPGGGGETGPLTGCAALDTLDLGAGGLDIVDLDAANLSPIVTDVFNRYTAITTPSGRRIHFVAESGVSDAKIRRAREVMRMHLTNVPQASAGADKSAVFNAIGDNCGTIAMFANPTTYNLSTPAVATFDEDFGGAYVPLFGNRIVVEGSPEYTQQNPAWDQTMGATAVLVYRLGLRVAQPSWANQLELARINAEADGTFVPNGFEPYRSTNEAFVGVLLESHSGVWGHDPSGDGSAQDGVYEFGSRPAMAAGDASTLELIENFFTRVHFFDAEIDPGFSGTFDMLFLESRPYSNRAQYLRRARLMGSSNAELFGTEVENFLVGNAGNNNIKGRSGNDVIDGGPGLDSAIYSAPQAEFTVSNNGNGTYTVQHNVTPGAGTDLVRNVVVIVFSDGQINL